MECTLALVAMWGVAWKPGRVLIAVGGGVGYAIREQWD
jgi:hypothetical protein